MFPFFISDLMFLTCILIFPFPKFLTLKKSLHQIIDSLVAHNYDNKQKLLFLICDGNIIRSGNDRTTPQIVLDILRVDPKLDLKPLLFKLVGEGSHQINYSKTYMLYYTFSVLFSFNSFITRVLATWL
jgi:chitin synthase